MNYLPANLFETMRKPFAAELGIKPKFDTAATVLVVTGRNAAGKSLLRRWFQMVFKQQNIECIHLSMEGRADAYSMARGFIYGSETDDSTGAMTVNTFLAGMRTSRKRDSEHVLLWDEPEIGMGDELQVGTADWLCEQLNDWPTHLRGVILLTHSKFFVRRAMQVPGAMWLSMDGIPSYEAWLNRDIIPVNPEKFHTEATDKWRRITKILGAKT